MSITRMKTIVDEIRHLRPWPPVALRVVHLSREPSVVPNDLVEVLQTDGLLRLYNVWDSGRGHRPFESQSATSGMLASDGTYRCSDIALDPAFDCLTFAVDILEPK